MNAAFDELVVTKYHGLGNDFLVLLDAEPGRSGAELARRLCNRHRGIGADGLIFARQVEGSAQLAFELWNADGSEAEMSGNGIRCMAHAALDEGWIEPGTWVGVETLAGRREVSIRPGPAIDEAWATVEMGPVNVHGEEHRCNVGHGQLLVDLGNPHLVIAGADPATVDVAGLGPVLEATDAAGLNIEFVTLGPGPNTLTMRVWERGVGETEACGTGACAAAAAFVHWARVGPSVTVVQPGGALAVEIRDDGTASLTGPSVRVASCQVRVK